MSRAYRIRVRESVRRVVRGSDRVVTQLELLDVLPAEQMRARLSQELASRGFQDIEGEMVRTGAGVTIRIDPASGAVCVESQVEQDIKVDGSKSGWADEDFGGRGRSRVEAALREKLQRELARQVDQQSDKLQQEANEQLEAALRDLQGELDGVINRVTADALKTKAAQLGEIKYITEDAETGNLTIVLEV